MNGDPAVLTLPQEEVLETKKTPKTRRRIIIAAFASVGVIGCLGYRWLAVGTESTDDAQVAADMVPIATRVAGAIERPGFRADPGSARTPDRGVSEVRVTDSSSNEDRCCCSGSSVGGCFGTRGARSTLEY
jgi:hypothetical protein